MASEVYAHVRAGRKVVAVVSALAGQTDQLLADARSLGLDHENELLPAYVVLGVIVLILLLVFIIQNNVATRFEYMAWTFSLPLGVAMLLSAIAGALIMALVGSVRMFSLGHRVRKLERERERIRTSLHG